MTEKVVKTKNISRGYVTALACTAPAPAPAPTLRRSSPHALRVRCVDESCVIRERDGISHRESPVLKSVHLALVLYCNLQVLGLKCSKKLSLRIKDNFLMTINRSLEAILVPFRIKKELLGGTCLYL